MEQIWKVAVYGATTHPLIKHFPKQIPKWGNCEFILNSGSEDCDCSVSYTHLRAHET